MAAVAPPGFASSSACRRFSMSVSKPALRLNPTTRVFAGLRPRITEICDSGSSTADAGSRRDGHCSISLRLSSRKAPRWRFTTMCVGNPLVPYRTPGENTWQWVDMWNALYRERQIFIGEHINDEMSNQILATMLYLDGVDSSKRICIYINGGGGDITPSLVIYDGMLSLKSPVATQCLGSAYGMSTFILAAGDKGNRSALPVVRIELQPPYGVARGQADDIQIEANELIRIRDYLYQELAKKTGQPVEKIHKDIRPVKRLDAQQALEYGLIDQIIRPGKNALGAPPNEQANKGLG